MLYTSLQTVVLERENKPKRRCFMTKKTTLKAL